MRPDEDALDERGQAEIEGRAGTALAAGPSAKPEPPPAGPHGAPELTEPMATPGTGALPGTDPDDEAEAATG